MKNVLITGATGGIGNALIRIFYENGYNICATGTNNEKLSLIQDTYKERELLNVIYLTKKKLKIWS